MPGRPSLSVSYRRSLPHLLLACAIALSVAVPVSAQTPGSGQGLADLLARNRERKARAVELMSQGARRRIAEARERVEELRKERRKRGAKLGGAKQHPAVAEEENIPVTEPGDRSSRAPRLGASAVQTVPTNVRCNNPAGDAANTTQSEESIASWGNYVVVAWNDGIGPQYQGIGHSTDGGQTFVDDGVPPGLTGWSWSSDPVITVNEKTGTFYYCGLVDPTTATNGIGIVPITFTGSTINWGTPVLVRSVANSTTALDKQWMVADSLNGNLYLTYTTFTTTNKIEFQRSTNGGTTWSAPVQISSAPDNGLVQGSRPAVGPNGELYAVWSAIGPVDVDFFRFRKSANQGTSWLAQNNVASVYSNFGTGAPGFNRERGVDFPSITVDRTTGPNRGRVYVTWTESINWYDDPLGSGTNVVEVENNNFFNRANAFTPGQKIRGTLTSTADLDYFSFAATQGTNYIFACDSIPTPMYSFRVFCGQDTTSRLAYAGDLTPPSGGGGFIVWTAPTTGTYYLRLAFITCAQLGNPGGCSSTTGGYRIVTGVNTPGPERSLDSRDVFVASTDNATTWSTPSRANDAAPRYDEFLPEVMVGADGMPYVTWFDWRDDGCGARSYQYMARSSDGGATWAANQRHSDVQNDWTSISLNSNLAPDQGDYSHMYADARYLRPAWADGRVTGNPDVYTTRMDTWHDISICQGDLAANSGTSINPSWTVANLNPLFANDYTWTLTSQRNWPLPVPGNLTVGADATGAINLNVPVPDSAAAGVNPMCLSVLNAKGTRSVQCCFNLTVTGGPVGVGPSQLSFDLGPGVPNPASSSTRIDYSLPQNGPVQLRIFGLRGELVRTLVSATRSAGPNTAVWDGRDDQGRGVGSGTYFYRLEAFGQSRVRRIVWLR